MYVFFSDCMMSKICQSKFGAHKLEIVHWNRIKPFEKNQSRAPPHFPIRSSGGPNFIIARVSNLPIASLKGHQIYVPLRHQGPNFLIRSYSSPRFPQCFINGFQFLHSSSKGKGPKYPIALLRASNFLIKMMTSNFPSRYQGVPIHHCVIKGPPLWPLISHHIIKGSHLALHHQGGPFFTHRVIKGTQIFQDTSWDMYWLKSTVFQSYNRDKRVQSLSSVYVGEGSKE